MSAHDVMESVYGNWASHSLDADVAGGLWLSLAPKGTAYPYCVYDLISSVPTARMNTDSDTGTEIFDLEFQLALYDDKMSTLAVAAKAVRAAYDYAPLTLGAGEGGVLQVRCTNEIPTKLEDDIWQWVISLTVTRYKPIDPSGS